MASTEPIEGWFTTPDRPGDRTLEMQLLGLDPLLDEAKGVTVLDIGCAEGLVSMEMARRGAQVTGIEIVPGHIEVAKRLRGALPCRFEVADANVYEPDEPYDIVLMLAVLHKLRDPSRALARFAKATKTLAVIRLPPEHAPAIVDKRSGGVKHDTAAVMAWYGFHLERVTRGSFAEHTAYWRRHKDKDV